MEPMSDQTELQGDTSNEDGVISLDKYNLDYPTYEEHVITLIKDGVPLIELTVSVDKELTDSDRMEMYTLLQEELQIILTIT